MFVESSIIEEGDVELYSYGFFMLISRLVYFTITLVTGFIMNIPLESIVFYTTFMALRTYAGGVHAKTETSCTLLTIFAITMSLVAIKHLELSHNLFVAFIMVTLGCLGICLLAPLDTNEKPLDEYEKQKNRRTSVVIQLLLIVITIVAQLFSIRQIGFSIAVGIFLEGILLMIGKALSRNTPEY